MHQKKIPRVKNILHTIPILHSSSYTTNSNNRSIVIKNKHLRYVSSSIPLACSVALLLLSIGLIVPIGEYHNVAYADETTPTAETTEETTEETTSSLIIGGAGVDETVMASAGDVAYRKHTVTVDATNSDSFYLMIKGPERLRGSTKISGAGGNIPEEMPDNSWGYAYSESDEEAALSYQSFDGTMQTIDSGTEAGKFTKNLIFAAKFGNSAAAGNYTGTVVLSLAASPAEAVTPNTPVYQWNKLEYLQQMTMEACYDAGPVTDGSYPTINLKDSRDGNTYTVKKLADGNCWIDQNLKLSGKTLTAADSDVGETDYVMPSGDSWGTSTTSQNILPGTSIYGSYYSYCTSTAGSCKSEDAVYDSKYSICPRGWMLPSGSVYVTTVAVGNQKKLNTWTTIDSINGYSIAGGFFPAAYRATDGVVSDRYIGGSGVYMSSTSNEDANANPVVNVLSIRETSDARVITEVKNDGYPVRCVAKASPNPDSVAGSYENTPVESWEELEYLQQIGDGMNHSSVCDSVSIGTKKTLKDSRDNNEYTIEKLQDGNCWMTQNLRIADMEITSANSDLDPAGATYFVPDGSENWSSGATAQNISYANSPIYGNYYSYCTATANSCVSGSGNASYSICPKGWRLPSTNHYSSLISAGSSNIWTTVDGVEGYSIAGGFFPAAYRATDGVVSDRYIGGSGVYMSSTSNEDANANPVVNVLSIRETSDARVITEVKNDGYPVRCVAR